MIKNVLEPHLEFKTEMIPLEPPSGCKFSVMIINNELEPHFEMIPLEPPAGSISSVI